MSHRCYAGGVKTLDGATPTPPTAWCACGWEQEFSDWPDAAKSVQGHRGMPVVTPSPAASDSPASVSPEQTPTPAADSAHRGDHSTVGGVAG